MATPRLRVTYGELQKRVQRSKEKAAEKENLGQDNSMEKNHTSGTAATKPRPERKNRRPDQVIYRPGQMRQVKSSSPEDAKPTQPDKQQAPVRTNQVKTHVNQPQDDFADLREESSRNTTPPGRKFGPRRLGISPTANSGPKKVASVTSTKDKNSAAEDSEEELMLDAAAMVPLPKDVKGYGTENSNHEKAHAYSRARKGEGKGRQGGDVQSRVFSRSRNVGRDSKDTDSDILRGPVGDERGLSPTPQLDNTEEVETIYTRKVDLGGNMKITCKFSSTSLNDSLEEEKSPSLNQQNENDLKINQAGQTGKNIEQSKSPRGKLHTVIKAREKYDSGSSAGDEKLENFGKFASESDNWDPEMDRVDYQLQTMVISSSRRKAGRAKQDGERDKEELRRPRSNNFIPDHLEEEDEEEFFWDEEAVDPRTIRSATYRGQGTRVDREDKHTKEKGERVSHEENGRRGRDVGRHKDKDRSVRGRGPVGARLRQDSESSEEWNLHHRKRDTRVDRFRRESGNSRSSEDYYSDSDKNEHEERQWKGGGLLHLGSGSSPKAIPGSHSPKASRASPAISHSPSHSPKPKDKTKDSRLWDPSKPNQRPALEQKQNPAQLTFLDSEADVTSSAQKSVTDQPSYDYGSSYAAYDPKAYPPYQYPGGQTPASQSWAEQVDYSYNYAAGSAQPTPPGVPFGYYSAPPPQNMNFDPQQVALMHGKRAKEQAAMQVVIEAANKETEFSNAVSRGIHSKENLTNILTIRKDLEKLYEGIVLLDLQISNQYNIEQLLWKNAYYQLCELMKKEESSGDSFYRDAMIDLLQSGSTFYEELLEKLQSTYCFKLDTKTGLDPLHEEPRRTIKLAILSAQRCMIALGDIARYKEQACGKGNYGRARSWYSKAQKLAPRNGKPYNQLAILALYTRRKLDAVYFYMRSLAASNPFITARESLMTLFEEVRKKIEHKEQEMLRMKKEKESRRRQKQHRRYHRGNQEEDSYRKEVWIHYDGSQSGIKPHELDEDDDDDESDEESTERELKRMPPAELNKRFVLSFLNVHGKLFTKIGMEAFSHAVGNLLKEFSALLSQSPTPITSTRLLQLMAINMFAVENTNVKDERTSSEDLRPYLQELAIQFGLDMFIILVQRCSEYLKSDLRNKPDQCLSEDLHEMLPAVKVFADWMMCHPAMWNPPPNVNEEHLMSSIDIWETLASFLNVLKDYEEFGVDFMPECEDSEEILLPEDHMLSGFVPLLALPLKPLYVSKDVDKVLAMDSIRITSLKLFGEFIYGQETPLITFDGSKDCYISVAPKMVRPSKQKLHGNSGQYNNEMQGEDDVVVLESYEEDGDTIGDGEDNHISHLRERRYSLEKQLMEQQQKKAKIQQVIEKQRTQRDLIIEINPIYLVPDTNCFIDHLPAIEELIASLRYVMIVPLVVINELDGLSLGGQGGDPPTSDRVATRAAEAVEFLERLFDVRNKHLKAMTSEGNILDTIVYRSEESKRIGNNDDLILSCCLHYCDDEPRNFMPADRDAPIKLHREVVLLTNDRNLRVKAIQQNVPTRDILAYLKWAKR